MTNRRRKKMSQYEVTQVITYMVEADSPADALHVWESDPRCGVVEWTSDKISLVDESIEVN
jgi:hypothetical protein